MNTEVAIERLFEILLSGDRRLARTLVNALSQEGGMSAEAITEEIFWPVYELIEKAYRADQLTALAHHSAVKLLRVLCDQAAAHFELKAPIGRSVLAFCGPTDADELAAQIATDLIEREGYDVRLCGAGIANDEILEAVQETTPDVLVIFASAPQDLPAIRELIDTIQEIGASAGTQIIVGGGVFNRAEGLAEEIGADLWATDPRDLVTAMIDEPERRMEQSQRTVGKKRPVAKAA